MRRCSASNRHATPPADATRGGRPGVSPGDRAHAVNVAVARELVSSPTYGISRVTIVDARGVLVIESRPQAGAAPAPEAA